MTSISFAAAWLAALLAVDPQHGAPEGASAHPSAAACDMAAQRRRPSVLVVSCSDSRIDAAHILGLPPGDVYAYRVPGNIVALGGGAAAEAQSVHHILRSALQDMQVGHIVVLAHTQCSAIEQLVRPTRPASAWAGLAGPIAERVAGRYADLTASGPAAAAVGENVRLQRERLLQHPEVQRALRRGTLASVEAYVYDLRPEHCGSLARWDDATRTFVRAAGPEPALPLPRR